MLLIIKECYSSTTAGTLNHWMVVIIKEYYNSTTEGTRNHWIVVIIKECYNGTAPPKSHGTTEWSFFCCLQLKSTTVALVRSHGTTERSFFCCQQFKCTTMALVRSGGTTEWSLSFFPTIIDSLKTWLKWDWWGHMEPRNDRSFAVHNSCILQWHWWGQQ